MNQPIKAGDEAIIINGALGPERCLNRGRRVIVLHQNGSAPIARGELVTHDKDGFVSHGTVWRVRTKDGKSLRRIDGDALKGHVPPDQCDCAASWLQKADPLPPITTREDQRIETPSEA